MGTTIGDGKSQKIFQLIIYAIVWTQVSMATSCATSDYINLVGS